MNSDTVNESADRTVNAINKLTEIMSETLMSVLNDEKKTAVSQIKEESEVIPANEDKTHEDEPYIEEISQQKRDFYEEEYKIGYEAYVQSMKTFTAEQENRNLSHEMRDNKTNFHDKDYKIGYEAYIRSMKTYEEEQENRKLSDDMHDEENTASNLDRTNDSSIEYVENVQKQQKQKQKQPHFHHNQHQTTNNKYIIICIWFQ
jgi:hypothetical protein